MNRMLDASTAGVLSALNERSREIFRRIVDSYLADGRARGLAPPVAPAAHGAVARLDPQRHAGSRGTGTRLRPPYQRRPAADPDGAALLRRRPAGDRRHRRGRAAPHRGGSPRRLAGAHARRRAGRGQQPPVGPDAGRRRGGDQQGQCAPEAHRIRAAGTRAGPGDPRRRGRFGREPRRADARGPAGLGAGRGRQLPQCPHPWPNAWARRAARSRPNAWPPRASSTF